MHQNDSRNSQGKIALACVTDACAVGMHRGHGSFTQRVNRQSLFILLMQ